MELRTNYKCGNSRDLLGRSIWKQKNAHAHAAQYKLSELLDLCITAVLSTLVDDTEAGKLCCGKVDLFTK